ncbi:hypothetical protein C1645_879608 [Glomus cerebriforme]|uniref:F-box domain-containing protein n=1 Tax=Glomus cerebriforme TaxID=658196 RepID=A0A397SFF1_9GLOM|nr:hypothetical protein C1645_879608 [Glomus cerebriforme]
MSKLNRDVLYLIFEEFENDKNTLYSCLLVDKTWCEIIVPILWRDPWLFLEKRKEKLFFNVIISHLFDESGYYLNRRPLFDYISFCRHLNFKKIVKFIEDYPEMLIIENEIINFFINGNNENVKFTHLYIPYKFDYQLNLIPGAKCCFSDLEFLSCNTNINDNVLVGLIELCKSIKKLEFFIEKDNNYGTVKLIETPNKLVDIRFSSKYLYADESFCKIIENSLIKHANNIQYFTIVKQPITKILSSFINLKSLELDDNFHHMTLNCLDNLTLPSLQILKARRVRIKVLTSLIKNTSGSLIEIKIDYVYHDYIDNKRIIQAIYQNCPKLKYLLLLFRNNNIVELENLLINCQHMKGLHLLISNTDDLEFDWNYLFEILTKSSPSSLYRFKFDFDEPPKLEQLKLFFDNWKGRHPMLLQTIQYNKNWDEPFDLIEKCKSEGIIKKYDHVLSEYIYEDLEWIQKNIHF